jgi:hypothetical protein
LQFNSIDEGKASGQSNHRNIPCRALKPSSPLARLLLFSFLSHHYPDHLQTNQFDSPPPTTTLFHSSQHLHLCLPTYSYSLTFQSVTILLQFKPSSKPPTIPPR